MPQELPLLSDRIGNLHHATPDGKRAEWELVCRIADSTRFVRSPHLRGILLFITQEALEGRATHISEYDIAVTVLGRRADFNAQEDNIVRVQVRRLRFKLEEYFSGEGRREPVVVTIPRGSYVPRFEARLLAEPEEPPADLCPVSASNSSDISSSSRRSRSRWFTPLMLAGTTALALALFLLRGISVTADEKRSISENPLLARVFPLSSVTTIVVPDECIPLLNNGPRGRLTLEEYLNNTGVTPSGRAVMHCESDLTSYEEMSTAGSLLQVAVRRGANAVIRHPRQINIRDFDNNNFTLVGDVLSNPWYELCLPFLNYVFESGDQGIRIRNRSPQPGEAGIYIPAGKNGPTEYAMLSVLPNIRGTGSILLLAGTTLEATEQLVELITRKPEPDDLRPLLAKAKDPSTALEVLFEVKVTAGVASNCSMVANRFHSGVRSPR